jgi:DNA-binding HxlR family transcriptional regulator
LLKQSLTKPRKKNIPKTVQATVSAVYGCKWSLKILEQIRKGVCRPGAIERALPGLTTRVQSYYFTTLIDFGVLEKTIFDESPPRVEYAITAYGQKLLIIFDEIEKLQRDLESNSGV